MGTANFTTFTEADPGGKLEKSNLVISAHSLVRTENAYIYLDYGANYFSGDYAVLGDDNKSSTSVAGLWFLSGVSNGVGYLGGASSATALSAYRIDNGANDQYTIMERNAGANSFSTALGVTKNTLYYWDAYRDEAVGANGTYYIYVYSDSARTVLVGSTSKALAAKVDFQYYYAISGFGDGGAQNYSGWARQFISDIFPSLYRNYVDLEWVW